MAEAEHFQPSPSPPAIAGILASTPPRHSSPPRRRRSSPPAPLAPLAATAGHTLGGRGSPPVLRPPTLVSPAAPATTRPAPPHTASPPRPAQRRLADFTPEEILRRRVLSEAIRQRHRSQMQEQLAGTIAAAVQPDYETLAQLEDVPRGACPQRVREAIPVHVFHLPAPQEEEARSCCICLEDYKEGDRLKTLPCCHFCHAGLSALPRKMHCIDGWLATKSCCPLCLTELEQAVHDSKALL
ncbi:putative E3 ubiquitin-protein ligase RLIM [Paratrimastix pyriformis]|uniref:RING-type E3 ubiquitin transferase n=1 Tax=Paratrimastix pyriformis TaxID=342808 RepID=A0ABQ8UT42_9EUKA|nr:putative E3 ubiquitin-protein ligase RLIM [Paratrimastix pyriformis]